jgi:hypothetical protein
MAIMAGEAIEEGGQASMASAAAKRRRRPRQGDYRRTTTRTRRPLGGEMGGTEDTTVSEYERGQAPRGQRYAQRYGQQAQYVAQHGRLTGGRPAHQGAILAEFLVCIAIIALFPIVSPSPGSTVSPYAVTDLKKMGAIGVVFFGLALVPGDNGSRVAAWAGFLVMIVLLMNDLPALTQVLGIFSSGGTEPPGATS